MIVLLGPLAFAAGADPPLDVRMEAHWRLAASMQTELVRGNLPVVRQVATRLAELPIMDAQARLQVQLERLRAEALSIAEADTVATAADRLAHLGAACADCHVGTGGGPVVRARAFPPKSCCDGTDMVGHQWAADWLWLGLVAPSAPAWDRGARELVRVAPDPALHALAERAVGLDTVDARASAYADIVRACAGCHATQEPTP